MNNSSDVETGPLSDLSSQGLPEELLHQEIKFHDLVAEETSNNSSTATEETQVQHRERSSLNLDLRKNEEIHDHSGNIVFSPGGSEAYVFTSQESQQQMQSEESNHNNPREIRDPIFVEKEQQQQQEPLKVLKLKKKKSDTQPEEKNMESVQRKLQELRMSLELEDEEEDEQHHPHRLMPPISLSSTAESSPRNPMKDPIKRRLPRIREQQHQRYLPVDPSGNLSSEMEFTSDMDGPVVPRLQLTERAISPSMASVISAASSTASGMLSGRKNLEWDSGADLGYMGELQLQSEVSLSTLEKMAIGNYSNMLRSDETEFAASSSTVGASSRNRAKMDQERRALAEEEMRQARLSKFADSLMKQRELRAMAANNNGNKNLQQPRRRRSKSRDKSETPMSSPSHNRNSKSKSSSNKNSPIKSTSLTDLRNNLRSDSAEENNRPNNVRYRDFRSNSDVSQQLWMSDQNPNPNLKKHTYSSSDQPSSFSSSTATVVPTLVSSEKFIGQEYLLPINTDQASLPLHLQGLFQASHGHGQDPGTSNSSGSRNFLKSSSSLASRRSGSRSFETVVNIGGSAKSNSSSQHRHPPRSHVRRKSSSRSSKKSHKWVTKDNLHSDEDSEEENENARKSAYFDKRLLTDVEDLRHHHHHAWQDNSDSMNRQISKNSSVATTSDEEKYRYTSTIESTQLDRAKSFEYFPGETYPMQENSSSYEYLPGHLVADRPGTVVSNYDRKNHRIPNDESNHTNNSTTSSSASTSDINNRARRKIDLGGGEKLSQDVLDQDLHDIAEELNERSKELLDAHVKKTKRFYKKMKRYIAYVSTPSVSSEDSRKKQEMINKLLKLMNSQEDKLMTSFPKQSIESSEESEALLSFEAKSNPNNEVDGRKSRSVDEDVTAKIADQPQPSASIVRRSDIEKSHKEEKDKVSLHKKRIEQMKVLRKEIKKLEKLEYNQLKEVMTNQLLAIHSDTDQSQSSIVSSHFSSSSFKTHVVKTRGGPTDFAKVSTSKQQQQKDLIEKNDKQEFGQTYPTPREVDIQIRSTTTITKTTSVAVQVGSNLGTNTKKQVKKPPKKPVSYYLPVPNAGPLRIGSKLMQANEKEEVMNKENRSILANYMASIDIEPLRRREEPEKEKEKDREDVKGLSLKEALNARNPNFVRRAEERRRLLQNLKDQRLELEKRRRRWVAEIETLSPRARKQAESMFPQARIQRVFNYKEMVMSTRKKYNALPEVRYKVCENKKKSSFRTNRVMKEMYKRKLQENVLRGKVSLVHHRNVIEF